MFNEHAQWGYSAADVLTVLGMLVALIVFLAGNSHVHARLPTLITSQALNSLFAIVMGATSIGGTVVRDTQKNDLLYLKNSWELPSS
ncbi:hypothetical protein WJX72_007552 [[Myrmecia] bisecta]|uniref:Uncharacterized protein n=1 Tax=[Myrmecia] bisecta TaxID=41462 RepID=A0AAW1PM17_9CHLO